MSKILKIEDKYLEEVFGLQASKMVGKVMKRIEICQDVNSLKLNLKEIIYESYRDLRDLMIAHDKGWNMTTFKFTNNKENLTKKE